VTKKQQSEGEPATAPPPGGSFGDAAAEMANETEVEGNQIEGELATLATQLAERTADLQRVQAEYLNYKRRVDRDRELVKQNATYAVLAPITEVMDTIDRAREHGELEGGFKAVADQLERILTGVGLVKFGAVGDPFDPTIHEALSHIGEDPEVSVTTCKVIAKAGYRIGDRVVRAAQVLVVDPAAGAAPAAAAGDVLHEREDQPGDVQNHADNNAGHDDVANDDVQND
jgi:molecular chaperone GrpE